MRGLGRIILKNIGISEFDAICVIECRYGVVAGCERVEDEATIGAVLITRRIVIGKVRRGFG